MDFFADDLLNRLAAISEAGRSPAKDETPAQSAAREAKAIAGRFYAAQARAEVARGDSFKRKAVDGYGG